MCKNKNGSDLVSIETENEWKYINGVLQNQLAASHGFINEYSIGLRRKSWKSWKWINNAKFSFNRNLWKDTRPRGATPYAFMGIATYPTNPVKIFSDANALSDAKPYICETKLGKHNGLMDEL